MLNILGLFGWKVRIKLMYWWDRLSIELVRQNVVKPVEKSELEIIMKNGTPESKARVSLRFPRELPNMKRIEITKSVIWKTSQDGVKYVNDMEVDVIRLQMKLFPQKLEWKRKHPSLNKRFCNSWRKLNIRSCRMSIIQRMSSRGLVLVLIKKWNQEVYEDKEETHWKMKRKKKKLRQTLREACPTLY